ncbi:MAG: VOC family protein [bacterium]|nr:VOC family protein [bacterium]
MIHLLVNVDVDDLARGIAFYTRAFDLRLGRHLGPAAVELLGASSAMYLLAQPPGSRATAQGGTRDYTRHWTPVHLDVVVRDVDAALVRAVAAGATAEGPIRDAAFGRLVRLADPFGNGLCLLQLVGRGYDEIAGTG